MILALGIMLCTKLNGRLPDISNIIPPGEDMLYYVYVHTNLLKVTTSVA